jgi:DNA-binding beta-propeller fold protein YncE
MNDSLRRKEISMGLSNLSSRSLSLIAFVLLPLFFHSPRTTADAAMVYEPKAFLPIDSCTSVDLSPDGTRIYARMHSIFGKTYAQVHDGVSYEHLEDLVGVSEVYWTFLAGADGTSLYTTDYFFDSANEEDWEKPSDVLKLDASTGEILKRIPVGPFLAYMTFDSRRRFLYVGVNSRGTGVIGSVSVIDTVTDTVVGNVPLDGEPGGFLVVSPDDAFLYLLSLRVWHGEPETLFKIRLSDLSVAGTLPIPNAIDGSVSISPDGSRVYVAEYSPGTVHIVDTDSMTETGTYDVPDVRGFSIAPSGDRALAMCHVPNTNDALIHVFDLPSKRILQTLSYTVADGLYRVRTKSTYWDRATGRAFIPIESQLGGVIVLGPATGNWDVVRAFEDDFEAYESTFEAENLGGWEVQSGGSLTPASWQLKATDGSLGALGSESPYLFGVSGNYMISDSDLLEGTEIDEWLVSPPIDCSALSEVILSFSMNLRTNSSTSDQHFDVDVSVYDEDTSQFSDWQNVFGRTINDGSTDSPGKVDLSAVADGNTIKLRWRYHEANYDWWWAVDDILLEGLAYRAAAPTVCCLPDGTLSLTWQPFGAEEYFVEWTDDLGSGQWSLVGEEADWPQYETSCPLPAAIGCRARFYRVGSM